MAEITMRELLKVGAHFGHQTRYWAPKMAPYIFGDRDKIHIIDLEQTLPMLQQAMNYLGGVAAKGGKVLFVGTKRQAGQAVREHALRCNSPYVDCRWLGGMLTNYKTVKNSVARLKAIEQRIESGATANLNKKEALTLDRERAKLDKTLSGIKDMNGLPDALFIIDVEEEYIAVAEAVKLKIPVAAVVDTNCSPQGIDYIIPGNDDSSRAIAFYLEAVADSIIAARIAAAAPVVAAADDYLEVDESGQVVKPRPKRAASKVKAKSAESVAPKARAAAAPADKSEAGDADGAERSQADARPAKAAGEAEPVVKKTAVKKTGGKKTAGKKTLVVKPADKESQAAKNPQTPPAKAESAKAEPAKAEPAKAESAKAEPAKAEPAKAESAKAEPADSQPANPAAAGDA